MWFCQNWFLLWENVDLYEINLFFPGINQESEFFCYVYSKWELLFDMLNHFILIKIVNIFCFDILDSSLFRIFIENIDVLIFHCKLQSSNLFNFLKTETALMPPLPCAVGILGLGRSVIRMPLWPNFVPLATWNCVLRIGVVKGRCGVAKFHLCPPNPISAEPKDLNKGV